MVNIPNWIWILCILLGLVLSTLYNRILSRVAKSVKLKIPIQRFEYLVLLITFLILVWNTSFVLRITAITAGSPNMNTSDINVLIRWSSVCTIFAYVVLGFVAGEIIFVFIEGIKNQRKKDKPKEVEVNISTKRLESVSEEIEGYRKAKADLDDFFEKLTDAGRGNEKPKQ